MNEPDSPYATACPFCGRPDPDTPCECMQRTPSGDASTIADLRAQIAQQAETIREQSEVIAALWGHVDKLRAQLEGRAKGSEQ